MVAKKELLREIDAILQDLSTPLSQSAINYGWTEAMRAFWHHHFVDLRDRVVRGGRGALVDFTVLVGLNMNGLDKGPIAERAEKISGI